MAFGGDLERSDFQQKREKCCEKGGERDGRFWLCLFDGNTRGSHVFNIVRLPPNKDEVECRGPLIYTAVDC